MYAITNVEQIDNKKSIVAGDVSSTNNGRDSHRTHNTSDNSKAQKQKMSRGFLSRTAMAVMSDGL